MITLKRNIWELQREYQACPAVYGVWVRCAGEETLSDLYESQEAANLHRDYYNAHNRNGYLGKATVPHAADFNDGDCAETLR